MTKEDFYKLVQDVYDALCPDHKHTLKPVEFTEENIPQLMLSLWATAQDQTRLLDSGDGSGDGSTSVQGERRTRNQTPPQLSLT